MPVNVGEPMELEPHSSKEIPDEESQRNMLTGTGFTSDGKGTSSVEGNDDGPEETVNGAESAKSEYSSDRASSSTRETTPASCAMVTENMLQEEQRLKQEQENEREEEGKKEVSSCMYVCFVQNGLNRMYTQQEPAS